MRKFLTWLKWSIAMMFGLYCGLLLSAAAIGLYQGGYFILFAFGSVLLFGPLAAICLLPFAVVYKLTNEYDFKQPPNVKVIFTHTLAAGFLGLSIVYEITKIPAASTNNDSPMLIVAIVLTVLFVTLIAVLSAHKQLKRRGFSSKKMLSYLTAAIVIIFAIQYYISLPHLTTVCRSIEVGTPRTDAIEALQPFRDRDLNGLQYRYTNAEQLDATEGNIFIQDNGVFCRVTIEDGKVSDAHFIMDGP